MALLCSTAASAQNKAARPLEGAGRISVLGGVRWALPDGFDTSVAANGYPLSTRWPVALQGQATFGYGANDFLEGTIDLVAGFSQFTLTGLSPFQAVQYGALLGGRLTKNDWPIHGLVPALGIGVGPLLVSASSEGRPLDEGLATAVSASLGLTWRFSDRFGIAFEYRFVFARLSLSGLGSVNMGGNWFLLGFTTYFGAEPKKDGPSLSF